MIRKSLKYLILIYGVFITYAYSDYYIDFVSGSDVNEGIKAKPWKHHPYMQGWSGIYSHKSGDRFLFKGGIAWNSTCFPLSIRTGGIKDNSDYYGADTTWYSGELFTKPIFNGEYKIPTLLHLQSGVSFVDINNLELKCIWNNDSISGWCIYSSGAGSNIRIMNCRIHNWRTSHLKTRDDARGGIYFNNDGGAQDSTNVYNCHISNEDGGYMAIGDTSMQVPFAGGVALRSVQNAAYDTIDHCSSVFLHGGENIHDCFVHDIVSSFDSTYHTNNFYIDLWMQSPVTRPSYFYNNKIINSRANAAPIFPIIWGSPPGTGQSIYFYIFNNLIMGGNPPYGVDIGTAENMTDSSKNGIAAYYYIFNNTFEISNNTGCARTANRPKQQKPTKIYSFNNFGIFDGTSPWQYAANDSIFQSNNRVLSHAETAPNKLTSINSYAPIVSKNILVNQGLDPMKIIKGSLKIILDNSDNSLKNEGWDIGAFQHNRMIITIK